MAFPVHRPRRLRRTPALRALVRETSVSPGDLVFPLFISEAIDSPRPIGTMPGISQITVREVAAEARTLRDLGIGATILFGIPKQKDDRGTAAYDPNGPVPHAVKAIKDAAPELVVMTDVCVDEYTSHGHCGILRKMRGSDELEVDNDATLEVLAKAAVVHAKAGADIIAPSDMMDGRVGAIRTALDGKGFEDVPILSYAVKYASAFYGPFREAAECAPKFGDRAGYQMDPGNAREALTEASLDIEEGADMLMVKPALPYLDVLRMLRDAFDVPIGAYNVSGEYAMIKAAAAAGMIDEQRATRELLLSIRRAGADFILTYHAKDVAKLL
ncbi:MAG: porphobilinogen synthase [Deltaproteobacteria bacterium]|nr:porphobilinogen synthase [Deltaproteobacteria bacterium]